MTDNSAMTITEFLEARIAEDEAEAQYLLGREDDEANAYGDRFNAECAAKRKILALADDAEDLDWQIANEWGGAIDGTGDDIRKALAAVYKDHPDYRQEWA